MFLVRRAFSMWSTSGKSSRFGVKSAFCKPVRPVVPSLHVAIRHGFSPEEGFGLNGQGANFRRITVADLLSAFFGKFSGLQGDPPNHTRSDQENAETGEEEADKQHR